MAEFGVRKFSKDWELLILSAREAWAVAQEAIHVNNEYINDNTGDNVDSVSFLDDLSSYAPLARIDVPDAVYTHGDPKENNPLGPLLNTKVALDNAIKKPQGLVSSLPRVGKSAVNHV